MKKIADPISFVAGPEAKSLKALRKKLNITQEKLSYILDVTQRTIARWESGERAPKGAALRLIQVLTEFDLWDKIHHYD